MAFDSWSGSILGGGNGKGLFGIQRWVGISKASA